RARWRVLPALEGGAQGKPHTSGSGGRRRWWHQGPRRKIHSPCDRSDRGRASERRIEMLFHVRFHDRRISKYARGRFLCSFPIRGGRRNWVLRDHGRLVGRFPRLKEAREAADEAWVDAALAHLRRQDPMALLPLVLRRMLLDAMRGDRDARELVHDLLEEHVNRNDDYIERDLGWMSSRPRFIPEPLLVAMTVAMTSTTRSKGGENCPPALGTEEITEERVERLKAHAEKMRRLAATAQERADEAWRVYARF